MLINRLHEPGLSRLTRLANSLFGLALVLMLAACGPIKFGYPVNTDALEKLKPGVSTKNDVLYALGTPRGTGAGRFSSDIPYHDGWFYEYTRIKGTKAELKILLVFFLDGRYDGHLWFSSSALLDIKE